jgi:hypothetical protein
MSLNTKAFLLVKLITGFRNNFRLRNKCYQSPSPSSKETDFLIFEVVEKEEFKKQLNT